MPVEMVRSLDCVWMVALFDVTLAVTRTAVLTFPAYTVTLAWPLVSVVLVRVPTAA
jgi:hypothetical protein